MAEFKPQRARFPIHTDNLQYVPDMKVLPGELQRLRDESRFPEEEMRGYNAIINANNRLYRKSAVNFNDPIAVFYVLDALLKVQRGHYIRPRYMVPYLRESHKQYYWTEAAVGRIVAGVWESCRQLYDEEYCSFDGEYDESYLPFARGRDSKGRYYVVDPKNGTEGILWLTAFRSNAYKRAQMLMSAELAGEGDEALTHAVVGYDALMEYAPDPIRTPMAYHAQLEPGRRFTHVVYDITETQPSFE